MLNMKKKIVFFIAIAFGVLVWSCDDEYNDLGVNIIGEGNYNFERYDVEGIKTFSKETGVVQTNNLPLNALGIYKNSFFGTAKASFVSQIELVNEAPTVGYNVEVDSVYLYVPYFSTQSGTLESGERTYDLNSVYGYDEDAKFDLKVYENGFFLNEFDPDENFEESQKYYNNQDIESYAGTTLLNDSSSDAQNTQFAIKNDELYIYKTDGSGQYVDSEGEVLSDQNDVTVRVIKERFTPGIWLDLNTTFFKDNILDIWTDGSLTNNNIFKNAFRGLYFKITENTADVGSMALLDFNKAELKVIYKASVEDDISASKTRRELNFRMGYSSTGLSKCNSINLIEYNNSSIYQTALGNMTTNEVLGDASLFIKGGQGSVAFIDLFGEEDTKKIDENGELVSGTNGIPDELDELRSKKWLINEASITFYVDHTQPQPLNKEPQRIYLYNALNNNPILDYSYDISTYSDPKYNKLGLDGILNKEGTSQGVKYRVRITEHIKYLLGLDDDELPQTIRLGLSVTEDINTSTSAYLQTAININHPTATTSKYVPVANVMNPLGTVLHGSNTSDTAKKPKLEIFYTEPN